MQFVKALYWIFYFYLCFERVIGDFGGVAKKYDGFTFILAGLLVQWRGFKNFSGSLKSCQKVERVRSENSAGLGSVGVLLTGVLKSYTSFVFQIKIEIMG